MQLTQCKYASALLLALLFAFCINPTIKAQNNSEVGAWIGTGTYFGDLNPDFNLTKTLPAIGGLYRYTINDYMAAKGGLAATILRHDDASSKNPYQQARNLSFRTVLIEVSGQIELHFQKFIAGSKRHATSPYVTAGLALMYFNPRTKYNDEWYNLQEVGTEGQNNSDFTGRKPYRHIQPTIPLGIGVKHWLSNGWVFFAEAAYRTTFTDYLDDVSSTYVDSYLLGDGTVATALADRSGEVGDLIGDEGQQRGNSVQNDGYLLLNVGITYTIFNKRCPQAK